MRAWNALALLASVGLYLGDDAVGSSMALADLAGRPVIALSRDGGAVRVPVQAAGTPAQAGEARVLGGTGVAFGFRMSYGLPQGGEALCTARFRWMSCTDGWTAQRGG
jgi:hypothetical protein